jgi:hypothetical protein
MVKRTVYLDRNTAERIRKLADSQGRSQAELIREALTSYARETARPKPAGVGRYRSGRSDVSRQAEKLLRKAVRDQRWP